jgi:hypothetical protein
MVNEGGGTQGARRASGVTPAVKSTPVLKPKYRFTTMIISYPPYTNFSRGRCLTHIGTEGSDRRLELREYHASKNFTRIEFCKRCFNTQRAEDIVNNKKTYATHKNRVVSRLCRFFGIKFFRGWRRVKKAVEKCDILD